MLGVVLALQLAMLTETFGNVDVYNMADKRHVIMDEFPDMPASFGSDLPPDGLRGFLVAGDGGGGTAFGRAGSCDTSHEPARPNAPHDGCSVLPPPPTTVDNFTGKWIVLLARYNCSFEVKIRNAQDAGYDCAIVHNVNSSELETMSAKNPEGIEIPSVFVSDLAGLLLGDEYLYTSGFYIMVNDDLPFNINTHLLLPFAIVVVLCLLVILVFMIVKCIKDRRRARRHRLPSRALKKIPTCKFSKGDPYDTCAICLDDYQEGERLRVLPCAHAYHAVCIDPWLTQNKRVCPVCKRRVFAAGERRRLHTDSDSTDTEPLLNDNNATQGGTFEEQRENPFVRAARFMSRLRARRDEENAQAASPTEDNDDEESNVIDDTVETDDREALISSMPAVSTSVTSERRSRRRARSRSETARDPTPPVLLSHEHSINTEAHGEIGVAALPAPQSSPHHVDL